MPGVLHVLVLVGIGRTVAHPEFGDVVDLAADRVVEEEAECEVMDVERVLDTAVEVRVGRSEVDQVVAVQRSVVVDVLIAGVSGLEGVAAGRGVGLGDLVALDLFLVVPYAAVAESPEGVERVALLVAVHHVGGSRRRRRRVGCHEVFRGDVVHHLPVARQGEGRRPLEFRTDDVAAFDGEFPPLVGGASGVGEVVGVTRLRGYLYGQQQVAGLDQIGVGRDVEPSVEQRDVGSEGILVGGFPRQVG